jgi:phage-related protein
MVHLIEMNSDVRLRVHFFRTTSGAEPVREWLLELDRKNRRVIGADIKTVQFGWPLGMPLVRKLTTDLWEVRSRVERGIARIIFTIQGDSMILLHGFIKKSQKTPTADLATARRRAAQFKETSL